MKLDDQGRCCGRKPIVYKRPPMLFCSRCDRAFDAATKEQIENWAYAPDGHGNMIRIIREVVLLDHITGPDCWCEPTKYYVNPDTGVTVWLHRERQ